MKIFFWDKLGAFWKNQTTKNVLAVIGFLAAMIFILFSNFSPQQVLLRTDEVASRNIVSNITAVVIDEQQTDELRSQAETRVQKAYQEDQYALANTTTEINNFFSNLRDVLATEEENKQDQVADLLKGLLSEDTSSRISINELVGYLLNTEPDDITAMENAALQIQTIIMDKPITQETLNTTYSDIDRQVETLSFSTEAEEVIRLLDINTLRPNLIYNQEATQKAILEARDKVQPVQKTVKAGEIIVREGDRVTDEQISILEQLGIQRTRSHPVIFIGTILFVLLSFWLGMEFLRRHHKEVYRNPNQMVLIGMVVVIILLITRFLTIIQIGDRPEINAMTGYLAPVAAGSMLIAILIDSRLAYFLTMMMALYTGLLTSGNQIPFVIVAFFGGIVGVYRVSRLSQTSDLAKSGLIIAGTNVATILTLMLMAGTITLRSALMGSLLGIISGILSAVLMIGALPYLETAFGITSMIKLLELSNPNHELLKRLILEAPGTYHHSLMVGNLAEATAESIGANPLLVRVGAYYHDIGKIKRPEYFIENQRGFNPHEKIAPALSALIVTSHVKEGLELAREVRLPEVITDFISGHHGTSMTKYFYRQAVEEDGTQNVNEETFRYEGPKPHSKEVALVMLADSVEAAVRSLPELSVDKVREMVRKIINDKLNEGQLEECDLTFRDLDVIARNFCKVLEGVYHKRIEYPETIALELSKRREAYGDDDHQPAG
ncbi:MAG: HDIG domain-containing protein [Bacillota bacterium]|nr:HDIG domain-containing protein [Bacillota bacterium]